MLITPKEIKQRKRLRTLLEGEDLEWDDDDNLHALGMSQEICSKASHQISHLKDRIHDTK